MKVSDGVKPITALTKHFTEGLWAMEERVAKFEATRAA
jgi:hypothetical protein